MALHPIPWWFPQPCQGVVEKTITRNSRGRVKYAATTWPAEFASADQGFSLAPQTLVVVVGLKGIVLLVTPI